VCSKWFGLASSGQHLSDSLVSDVKSAMIASHKRVSQQCVRYMSSVRLKDEGEARQHNICPAGQAIRRNRRRRCIAWRSAGWSLTWPLAREVATPRENGTPNPRPPWSKMCLSTRWLVRPGKCASQSGTAILARVRRASASCQDAIPCIDPRNWSMSLAEGGRLGSAVPDASAMVQRIQPVHPMVLSLANAVNAGACSL
jgi:hypothetical protein